MSGRMRTKLTARGPRRQPPPHHLLSEESRPTKEHYKILALCWAGWVFDIYDLILFTFLIRPIGMTFSLTKLELSYALGASLAASAVGGIVFGALADLYGRRRVLEWTIITYSLGTLLSGLTGRPVMLRLCRRLHRAPRILHALLIDNGGRAARDYHFLERGQRVADDNPM